MFLNHIKSLNNSIDFSLRSKQKVRFREIEYFYAGIKGLCHQHPASI